MGTSHLGGDFLFSVPKTLEEWQEATASARLAGDPVFARCRTHAPVEARLFIGFCRYFDSGYEAFERGDSEVADRCGDAMKKLVSWLSDGPPQTDATPSEVVERLIGEEFSLREAMGMQATLSRRGRGRPVSSRRAALDALEYREAHPKATYKQLAELFCQCSKSKHANCAQTLRQQMLVLRRTMDKLGV
jgi:hypothetical protein